MSQPITDLQTELDQLREENTRLHDEITRHQTLQQVMEQISGFLDLTTLLERLPAIINEATSCYRTIVLVCHSDMDLSFEYGAVEPALPVRVRQEMLESLTVNLNTVQSFAFTPQLKAGRFITIARDMLSGSAFGELALLPSSHLGFMPLIMRHHMMGLLILHMEDSTPLPESARQMLQNLAPIVASVLANAIHHTSLVEQLANSVSELNIMQQIDTELNDTIQLNQVFNLIIDWTLRFTNAQAVALALYDEDEDVIRLVASYGYPDVTTEILNQQDFQSSITKRVARSGMAEIVPDVLSDKDYLALVNGVRMQMSVPIKREGQVVAVLTLETTRANGFTDENLSFVTKLAHRAGIAVDNARLFTETNRERDRLSTILRNITDGVIAISVDYRIVLLNQAVVLALQLNAQTDYRGQRFVDVIHNADLRDFFRTAVSLSEKLQTEAQSMQDELVLPNGHTYHAHIDRHSDIGWIIVLQDVTRYKETEKLKTELLSTVSHDLKQPLSVMRGYLDLLRMTNVFDDKSESYMGNLNQAFDAMRQLIDDLLDIARIEAGLELEMEDVPVTGIVSECVEQLRPSATEKSLDLMVTLPSALRPIPGDYARVRQIISNLVSNAIKYTHPTGWVKVYLEDYPDKVRIIVQDNGMGISAEDQAHIFDRFYRVRRPETDSIEGTGLGLAIVKSLVEAHQGTIDVISELGKGTTFRVTLPRQRDM